MAYFVFAAGEDSDGLLTKNFISRLCNGHFMGNHAEKSMHNEAYLSLAQRESAVLVSIMNNHSDYDRLNKISLNSDLNNDGVFIIADPTSPNFLDDVNTRLNHLNSLMDERKTRLPVYVIGLKADLYTPTHLTAKERALQQCVYEFVRNNPETKIRIENISIISAKTSIGFNELKKDLLTKDKPQTSLSNNKTNKSWYHPLFPFSSLFESYSHPHARTLRTSFTQKLKDSFFVFAGKPPIFTDKPHVGLFDILIIPTLVALAFSWALSQPKTKPMLIPNILLGIINIPLLAARYLFGALATVLFSPITLVVHCISSLIAHKSNKSTLKLMGTSSNGKEHAKEQSLNDFLEEKGLDIENLDVSIKKLPSSGMKNSYSLMFNEKSSGSSASVGCNCTGECTEGHVPFTVKLDFDNPNSEDTKHAKNIHALFKLNVGQVVTHIEESRLTADAKASLLSF